MDKEFSAWPDPNNLAYLDRKYVKARNAAIYLIRDGQRHPLARPEVVERLGGWGKVFEVPLEVIASYEDGDIIE